MTRFLLNVLGVVALGGMLLAVPGCSSDDSDTGSGETGSGTGSGTGSRTGSSGSRRTGSTGGSESTRSESSSGSYGFCLGNSGWTCSSNEAKSACLKGSCGQCTKDPSQCSSGDEEGGGGGDDDF